MFLAALPACRVALLEQATPRCLREGWSAAGRARDAVGARPARSRGDRQARGGWVAVEPETRCSGTAPCFRGGEEALREGRLSFITTLRHGRIPDFLGISLGRPIDTPFRPPHKTGAGPRGAEERMRRGKTGPGGGWAGESGKDLQPAC